MISNPQHRFHAIALVTLALALTPGAARSEDEAATKEATAAAVETPAWDQAQVTEIAKELAATIDPLQTALREQPPPQLGSGQTNSQIRLRDKLRQLRNNTILFYHDSHTTYDHIFSGHTWPSPRFTGAIRV